MKQLFTKYKRFFLRVAAFLIAIFIMGACVLLSYVVPPVKVHADSLADDWEGYIDGLYGDGSYALVEEGIDLAGDYSPVAKGLSLLMLASEFIDNGNYEDIPLNSITCMSGYYYYNNTIHTAQTTLLSGQYFPADGGYDFVCADDYTLNVSFTGNVSNVVTGILRNSYPYIYVNGSNIHTYVQSSAASGLFSVGHDYQSEVCYAYYAYSIPTWNSANTNSSIITGWSDSSIGAAAGQGYSMNLGTFASNYLGIDGSTQIGKSNFMDFILYQVNPVIIQEYPELEPYLFEPTEDPTEEPTGGGCNCHVNVEVNVEPTIIVEPTINVYVENQLPSEWQEDYTISTEPVETLAEPTMPTVDETQEETLPTFELDGDVIQGLGFWRELWNSAMHATDFIGVITVLLLLSIAEWALWHIGR